MDPLRESYKEGGFERGKGRRGKVKPILRHAKTRGLRKGERGGRVWKSLKPPQPPTGGNSTGKKRTPSQNLETLVWEIYFKGLRNFGRNMWGKENSNGRRYPLPVENRRLLGEGRGRANHLSHQKGRRSQRCGNA